MKKIFLLFFIVLFVIPIALAVPVSYKGTITYEGAEITSEHTIKAVSASKTTTKTITGSNFVINHLVKKGEIVKFYFDDTQFTEYTQPLPSTIVDLGSWDITPAGLPDLYEAKSALTYTLILNGNPSEDNVIADLYLPTSLAAYLDVSIIWLSSDGSIAADGTVTRSETEDKTVTLTATLSQEDGTPLTSTFTVTVKQVVAATEPDEEGTVEIEYDEPEVVIDNLNIENIETIEIPETVNPNEIVSLNLESLMTEENTVTLGTNNLILTRKTEDASVDYSVEIPANTEISGASNWNGLLNLPTVKDNTEVETTGGTTELVIEVGYTGGQLDFTKAVKLTLGGMASKNAGYTGADDVFHTIPACTAAQIADPDTLSEGSDCYTDSGDDLIIWTKHFTKFAAYTPASTTTTTSGIGSSGGRKIRIVTPVVPTPGEEETAPAEEVAEITSEEEVVPTEKTPPKAEVVTPAPPRGLRAIAGNVIKVATEKKSGIIASIIIILVGGLFLFSQFYGGMPGANHLTRAAKFHKKAEKAYTKSKHTKSKKLYKKAQILREEGERRLR